MITPKTIYDIYMFSDGEWVSYAKVDKPTETVQSLTLPQISEIVENVNTLLINKICEIEQVFHKNSLAKYEHSYESEFVGSGEDQREIVMLHPIRHRGCTMFPIIQYNQGMEFVRILVYGTDDQDLGYASCCTVLSHYTTETLSKKIKKKIVKCLDKLEISDELREKLESKSYTFFV